MQKHKIIFMSDDWFQRVCCVKQLLTVECCCANTLWNPNHHANSLLLGRASHSCSRRRIQKSWWINQNQVIKNASFNTMHIKMFPIFVQAQEMRRGQWWLTTRDKMTTTWHLTRDLTPPVTSPLAFYTFHTSDWLSWVSSQYTIHREVTRFHHSDLIIF